MIPQGPVTEASPVEHDGPLPEAADLVVVGGGVAGVSAALHAARAGHKVVLVEKGRIAGEQSSRNWGWIRQQGRDPAEIPLAMEANRLWRDFARETNDEIGLRQTGCLFLMRRKRDRESYEAWLPEAQKHGLDTRVLSAREVADMLPGNTVGWEGGLWTPSDMRAEPWVAVPVLARMAAREGVTIRESCAVRQLDVSGGKVVGVITEKGRIRAGAVILATGAWTRLLLGYHGVMLPQLSVRATVCATEPLPEVFDGQATDDRLAFRRRLDGGYNVAGMAAHDLYIGPDAFRSLPFFLRLLRDEPMGTMFRPAAPRGYPDAWTTPRKPATEGPSVFEQTRVLDPAPNMRLVRKSLARFAEAFPDLPEIRLKRAWAGMIDATPDVVPVIDRAAALPGLTICTGLSGHGFGIGPAAGRAAALLATGGETGHDLSRFRLSRFSDGSKIRPGPHL
jgi:glycine/D-amino acid oxidase-like deaminating enzyme